MFIILQLTIVKKNGFVKNEGFVKNYLLVIKFVKNDVADGTSIVPGIMWC